MSWAGIQQSGQYEWRLCGSAGQDQEKRATCDVCTLCGTLPDMMYMRFAHSINRWAMLTGMIDSSAHSGVTLKRLCPTCFSSRYKSIVAIRYRYVDIIKALTKIFLTSDKKQEGCEAARIKKKIEKFTLIFQMVLEKKTLLHNAIQSLSEYCGAFDQAKVTAQTLAEFWNLLQLLKIWESGEWNIIMTSCL